MTTKWIDERSDDWLMSLSTRTRNFLVMAGYESRESVLSAFDLDAGQSFLKIPNFGSKSLCEVAEKLGRAAPVRSEYYAKALGSGGHPGWMTPDEVRALEEMAPKGGDADTLPKPSNQKPPPKPEPEPA